MQSKNIYIGVNNKSMKVTKAYIGYDNKALLFYDSNGGGG